ncbi:MAG TPA: hypothetical protein PLG50_02660 [bacterium]|nr:hypothetical protein [bacterium]HQG44546.1 hypothetical protein [bacterium]HQI47937.1 hypothetical protein [bacterium]HQJ64422.1 hypothetical protein [bacterium]HQJ65534.1 hypothetical protein [bacterium]
MDYVKGNLHLLAASAPRASNLAPTRAPPGAFCRHKTLAGRFGSFPKHQQLQMVANELNRASHLLDDPREYRYCLERALELLDLLSGQMHWRPALRELRRARQFIAQCYIGPQPGLSMAPVTAGLYTLPASIQASLGLAP